MPAEAGPLEWRWLARPIQCRPEIVQASGCITMAALWQVRTLAAPEQRRIWKCFAA
jgi:hypothetical protein